MSRLDDVNDRIEDVSAIHNHPFLNNSNPWDSYTSKENFKIKWPIMLLENRLYKITKIIVINFSD